MCAYQVNHGPDRRTTPYSPEKLPHKRYYHIVQYAFYILGHIDKALAIDVYLSQYCIWQYHETNGKTHSYSRAPRHVSTPTAG